MEGIATKTYTYRCEPAEAGVAIHPFVIARAPVGSPWQSLLVQLSVIASLPPPKTKNSTHAMTTKLHYYNAFLKATRISSPSTMDYHYLDFYLPLAKINLKRTHAPGQDYHQRRKAT
ncbi:hypothetical protein H5T88_04150 [bacterium]|nr:hypothetical protein [bacterium]